jgi:Protein of unknown function (DUF4230)
MRLPGRWAGIGLGAAAGVVVTVVALVLVQFTGLSGFGMRTIDRSGPALLESVRDISQYHDAVGDFQIVIDIEEDIPFVPRMLAGERTLFVAAGTVNVYIDFSGLADEALELSADRTSVRLQLPEPVLDQPNLDQPSLDQRRTPPPFPTATPIASQPRRLLLARGASPLVARQLLRRVTASSA